MKIDLNKFDEAKAYLQRINQQPLECIQWVRDGEIQPVPKETIEDFSFIGLSNTDFPKYAGLSQYGPQIETLTLYKIPKRSPLKPGSKIQYCGIKAQVLEDQGGETLEVLLDGKQHTWYYQLDGKEIQICLDY